MSSFLKFDGDIRTDSHAVRAPLKYVVATVQVDISSGVSSIQTVGALRPR